MLPAVLDPLPEDLSARVADADGWNHWLDKARQWQELQEGESAWDLYYTAISWWSSRKWDAGHLKFPPRIWMWRETDTVFVRWDNRSVVFSDDLPVWEAQSGEISLSVHAFEQAVTAFDTEFLSAMAERVAAVNRHWPRPEIAIDLDRLNQSQQEGPSYLSNALWPWVHEQRRIFSWEQVRAAIAEIEHSK